MSEAKETVLSSSLQMSTAWKGMKNRLAGSLEIQRVQSSVKVLSVLELAKNYINITLLSLLPIPILLLHPIG